LTNILSIVRANKDNSETLAADLSKIKVSLDEPALAKLKELDAEERADEYVRYVDAAMAVLRNRPLAEPEGVGARRTAATAVLLDPSSELERNVPTAQLTYANDSEGIARILQDAGRSFPEPLTPSLTESIGAILKSGAAGELIRPLYRYDSERTTEAKEHAEKSVELQYLKFAADDVLANAGPITDDEYTRLRAEHEAHRAYLAAAGSEPLRWQTLARGFIAILVVLGVFAYTAWYQHDALKDTRRRALSAFVVIAMFAVARLVYVSTDAPTQIAVGSVALATALLAIVYTPGIVLAVSSGLAIMTTLALREDVGFFVVLLVVIGTLLFGLREVRNRGKIVVVGCAAGAVALSASACVGLINGQSMMYSLRLGLWAGGATLLAAFIIEGVLPGIERLFRLSTGMTLLEWCDGSKPLLRMMAADAPGTYNHSLLVGTLAEAAAEAIGADGLLCRAGAYYHDIGKINKPEYFVENQPPGVSRHERLTPAMSLLIIVGHVKDGIEMAREYGLPESLRPFIAEHHGTTLVEYFYHAANRLRKENDREVAEAEFRYSGPKPQSRETAIVMMADGVEGAVRAMSEPTPARIEDVVREIIRKRLMDGQFDECELTFRDLAEIEKSLVKTLSSVYHARIVYPESESEAEEERDRRPVRSAS
jgi:putative nucleotidyltransferase with HDIG domain